MKPACWEACFLYPSPSVEHSNNCLLLLCRLFLEPSGHYTKNDNYGKILWTGSSFFATPENVPDCSNYKVLIFYNSIGAYSVWRDSILTFTYLANSNLYIDTFSVLRNGNTIKLTNNTRYCAGAISTSDIPITKIMGVV